MTHLEPSPRKVKPSSKKRDIQDAKKYSDNLEEIIKETSRNDISLERSESLQPIRRTLYKFAFSIIGTVQDKDFNLLPEDLKKLNQVSEKWKEAYLKQMEEVEKKYENTIKSLKGERSSLNKEITTLQKEIERLNKYISLGESAYLLDEDCNTPQKIYMKSIMDEIKIIEKKIKDTSRPDIYINRYKREVKRTPYELALKKAIKDRFDPEGWEFIVEIDEDYKTHETWRLIPKQEVYLSMGVDQKDLVPYKSSIWYRFWSWLCKLTA